MKLCINVNVLEKEKLKLKSPEQHFNLSFQFIFFFTSFHYSFQFQLKLMAYGENKRKLRNMFTTFFSSLFFLESIDKLPTPCQFNSESNDRQ